MSKKLKNACQEFLTHTMNKKVKYAEIEFIGDDYDEENNAPKISCNLYYNYSPEDLIEFLKKLNFDYDNGFGQQYLFGHIWYEDGSWSERKEYDGAESWAYKTVPRPSAEFLEKMTELSY